MQTERAEGNLKTTTICHYLLRNDSRWQKKLSDKEGTKAKLTWAWRTKAEGGVAHDTLCFGLQSVSNSKPGSEKKITYCPFKDVTASSYTHVMGSSSLFHTAVRLKVQEWYRAYVSVHKRTVRTHLFIHREGERPSGSEGPAFRRLAPSQGLQQLGCWTREKPGSPTRAACVPPMKSRHIWQHLLTTSTQPVLSAACDATHINTKIMTLWHRALLCAACGNEWIKCALTPQYARAHVFIGYLHFIVKTRFWGRASLFLLRDPMRSYEIWRKT